jgi:hypothetical protein
VEFEMSEKEKIQVDVSKFISFHRKRIAMLEEFLNKGRHGRLIIQISFLGLESLAKLLFPDELNSGTRFKSLISTPNIGLNLDETEKLYFWRNNLIHQGFISDNYTFLEAWDDDDDKFLIFEDKFREGQEYPPGSILAMYKIFLNYFEDRFKNVEKIEFKQLWE